MEPKLCGIAIQKWRMKRKLTQERLSDASGVKLRTLQNYEAGKVPKKLPLSAVMALAKALRCEVQALFVPGWERLYEGILLELQEVLLLSDSALDKTMHVARLSREVRQWRIFLEKLGIDDHVSEPPSEAQKQLAAAVQFMPEDADPLTDEPNENGLAESR